MFCFKCTCKKKFIYKEVDKHGRKKLKDYLIKESIEILNEAEKTEPTRKKLLKFIEKIYK